MSITFDAVGSGNGSSPNPLQFNHTVTSTQSNLLLYVGVITDTSSPPTGVTYNGISMTKLATQNKVNLLTTLWAILSPSNGTNQVSISWSSAPTNAAAVSASYYNVNQSFNLSNIYPHSGDSSNANSTGTGPYQSNSLGIFIALSNSTTLPTPTAPQNDRVSIAAPANVSIDLSDYIFVRGNTSNTMSATVINTNWMAIMAYATPLPGNLTISCTAEFQLTSVTGVL